MAGSLPTRLFINNEYVDAKSRETLTLYNPVDDSLLTSAVQSAGPEDVDAAVSAAKAALETGPWASFTPPQRAACLLRFADLVEKNAQELARLESLPTGRTVGMITGFDIPHMCEVFRYYAGWADKIEGKSFPPDNGIYKIVSYSPIGVCAGIGSWNATFLYIAWKIAPALAAGNTFIFKPSEKTPLGTLFLGSLIAEAGFPPGVVNFLSGAAVTGNALASHMQIRKISFTGSIIVGRKIQEAAVKSNLKRVTLELGGKSAAIVFSDAPFEVAVGMVGGGFLVNQGQVCVAASRVLIQKSLAEKFIAAVKEVFAASAAGIGASPLDPNTAYGTVVDKGHFNSIMAYVEEGRKSAQTLIGGKQSGDKGNFIEPTIFVDPPTDSKVWKEEIFGPVLCIRTFDKEEEAIAIANDTEYGLSACVYTSDVARALRVSSKLESGTVAVNCPYLPQKQTPFGGIKQSGYGVELGYEGLLEWLNQKTVNINMNIGSKL